MSKTQEQSIDLNERMETLQKQYNQVMETLSNSEIIRRKLEGAMEITQAMINESQAAKNGEANKSEEKNLAKEKA